LQHCSRLSTDSRSSTDLIRSRQGAHPSEVIMGTGLTRRTFVELGAAGVVLAATGGLTSSHAAAAAGTSQGRRRRDDVGVETDIAELQRLMALGQLSSEELTE